MSFSLTLCFDAVFELDSYSGIIVVEAGIVDWKDLRPFFMRVLPSTRKRLAAMPGIRKSLQEDLRAFIKSIGPGKLSCMNGSGVFIFVAHRLMPLVVPLLITGLGEIYYGKEVDWITIQEASRQGSTTDKKSN
jgi:hypothetical protein